MSAYGFTHARRFFLGGLKAELRTCSGEGGGGLKAELRRLPMHSSSQAVWLEQCRIWYARRRPAVLRGPLRHGRERNSLQPASRVLIPASARASIPASADYSARLGRRLSARLGRRRSARLGLESGLAWPGSSLTGKVRGAGPAVHRPGRSVGTIRSFARDEGDADWADVAQAGAVQARRGRDRI